jgi:hypothetical protein
MALEIVERTFDQVLINATIKKVPGHCIKVALDKCQTVVIYSKKNDD